MAGFSEIGFNFHLPFHFLCAHMQVCMVKFIANRQKRSHSDYTDLSVLFLFTDNKNEMMSMRRLTRVFVKHSRYAFINIPIVNTFLDILSARGVS